MDNKNTNQEFVGALGNRSISENGSYVACVQEALSNYNSFLIFKRDPRYQEILEHLSRDQGEVCLEIIRKEAPSLLTQIEKFKENDLIGGATIYEYKDIGEISPSTLRYIKVAGDLANLFGDIIGDCVAEIGVGYGGQLLIADKILKFKKYYLFDLPPVLSLASKYIESHTLNAAYKTTTLNQHTGKVEFDLVVSNYAFSELPQKLQLMYIEKVISKSKRGYLTMNSGLPLSAFQTDKLTLDQLTNYLPPFEIIQERPLTHPGNYIIVWGN